MKILDLLPNSEQSKRLKDVETALLRRRTGGTTAAAVALVVAVVEAVKVLATDDFGKLVRFVGNLLLLRLDQLPAIGLGWAEVVGIAVVAAGIVAWLTLRLTGLWLTESREPFRYTFWIEPFKLAADTPGDRMKLQGGDRFHLLHHDLAERLNQRIQRFSLLEQAPAAPGSDPDPEPGPVGSRRWSSHIQVSGNLALREERDRSWVIHVMPTVRIGPAGASGTLAARVKFPLPEARAPEHELQPEEYVRIVERVYSSIATEIYRQIETDVRRKARLFPTGRLRALALFHEAEDFARSNTIDAYERAIALYREALRHFDLVRVESLTWLVLRARWLLWRLEVRYQHEWAEIVAGYAKSVIYRREMSALAGRPGNTLYEIPELLEKAVANLEILHARIGRQRRTSPIDLLLAYALYPRESLGNLLSGRAYSPWFERQRRVLSELYLAQCLVYSFLDAHAKAVKRLERAKATAPDRVERDPLLALAEGRTELVRERALAQFRRAVDLAPQFQIARWYLAQAYERDFHQQDAITAERAQAVIDEYEEVLKLNYGSVVTLSAAGHLLWLTRQSAARGRLEEGLEIKAVAQETFIGDLNYRLARIAAECGEYDRCRTLYLEAIATDPTVGVHVPLAGSRSRVRDFDDIGPNAWRRFREYKDAVLTRLAGSTTTGEGSQANRVVTSMVLNDYGNACLRYFHYHGDDRSLDDAVRAYKAAIAANQDDARPWFNLQNAYSWLGRIDMVAECLRQARQLAPTWSDVAIEAATDGLRRSSGELQRARARAEGKRAELHGLESGGDARPSREAESRPSSGGLPVVPAAGGPTVALAPGRVGAVRAQQQQGGIVAVRSAEDDERARQQQLEDLKKKRIAEVEQAEQQIRRWEAEVDKQTQDALQEVRRTSRLGPMLEGPPKTQARRLTAIPWRRLEPADLETILAVAQIHAAAERDLNRLRAAKELAVHAMDMHPEDHRAVGILRDNVLPSIIARLTEAGENRNRAELESLNRLLQLCNERNDTIVRQWMQAEPNAYLALHWYLQNGPDRDDQELTAIREEFYPRNPDLFWTMLGHFGSRSGLDSKRIEDAYRKAIALKTGEAAYHFALGRAIERRGAWEEARVVYLEAHRLAPNERDYAEAVAAMHNLAGNGHYEASRYLDAIEQYREAARLAPNDAVYHANLAGALRKSSQGYTVEGLAEAVREAEVASDLEPDSAPHRATLGRLRRRQRAINAYGRNLTWESLPVVTPIAVEYAANLTPFILGSSQGEVSEEAQRRYDLLRDSIRERYGVSVHRARWRANDSDLPASTYLIMLQEVPLVMGTAYEHRRFCLGTDEERAKAGVGGELGIDPAGQAQGHWLDPAEWEQAAQAGLPLLDPLEYILRHLQSVLEVNLADFLGHSEVVDLLKASPIEAVKEAASDPGKVGAVTECLRGLLADRVPITEFATIAYQVVGMKAGDSLERVIEGVRQLPGIRGLLPGNAPGHVFVPLGDGFTEAVRAAVKPTGGITLLAMEPEACQGTLSAIRSGVAGLDRPTLVVSDASLRAHLRKLVELEFPNLFVLSASELPDGFAPDSERTIDL